MTLVDALHNNLDKSDLRSLGFTKLLKFQEKVRQKRDDLNEQLHRIDHEILRRKRDETS